MKEKTTKRQDARLMKDCVGSSPITAFKRTEKFQQLVSEERVRVRCRKRCSTCISYFDEGKGIEGAMKYFR